MLALLASVYLSTASGAVVEEVYRLLPVGVNTMGATTGAGIAAARVVPVPKFCVYNTFTNAEQGGVMAGTVMSNGVGWFSPTSSGLSLLFRSGLLPLVDTSLNWSPKILVPVTVAELL